MIGKKGLRKEKQWKRLLQDLSDYLQRVSVETTPILSLAKLLSLRNARTRLVCKQRNDLSQQNACTERQMACLPPHLYRGCTLYHTNGGFLPHKASILVSVGAPLSYSDDTTIYSREYSKTITTRQDILQYDRVRKRISSYSRRK